MKPTNGAQRYAPGVLPRDPALLQRFLLEEFNRIAGTFDGLAAWHWDVSTASPDKPREGDVRIADGERWNPGQGAGLYVYLAGKWNCVTVLPYGWFDLLGQIEIRSAGGSSPAFNVFRTNIREFQFSVGDEVWNDFHIPHDYVLGTDIFLHVHWVQNQTVKAGSASGTVTGGSVTWRFDMSYAKGHQQAAFPATVTTTMTQACSTTLYEHHIGEAQISAASPGAGQLATGLLEPDGLILTHLVLQANNITVASGSVPDPFALYLDIHYLSDGTGTKNKAPNFYV